MRAAKRVSAHHVAFVLRRERELAPELFVPPTAAEREAMATELARLDRKREGREHAPDLQLRLAIS